MKTNLSIIYIGGKKCLKVSWPGITEVMDRDAILNNTSKLKQRLAEGNDDEFNQAFVVKTIKDLEEWLVYLDTHN